ncbi:bile acid:sodium symporter [Sphingosinicella ginsenosidimutans]|uniref:Bile acid:sodium symporter n=1 Tax=Allosphingosinicella ginsenosidimutans TaxID=1176539 RepID=A0A5C6TQR6_9SPHN|nr:bile acid:sodium symporter family protein [Sphingosinicella ginsenosidimutans]TXC62559.1 bile acid:sodium symporter [Sphingosinicella ginsenosidimutans]
MPGRLLALFDPFVAGLIGILLLATIAPPQGAWAAIASDAANVGIVLLFFLHGAKLSRQAILDGARNWQLHLATLATTFVLFPLLGMALTSLPLFDRTTGMGLLFLTLLPSTVQSSIAFTSIARGNVAGAVCSASFSNLLGIAATPLLVMWLMGGNGAGISIESAKSIALQLLLPFVVGHLSRPLVGAFVARHKRFVSLVDRGSILLVVYTAFGAAVAEGLWQRLPLSGLALILLGCAIILGIVLMLTWWLGGALGFSRADRIVLLFCGSKKSLASGVPMAGVLFPPAQVGLVLVPLMIFHQIQLVACAVIARRLARSAPTDE